MFESYAKPAVIKAGPEPVPQPGILGTPIQAGGGTGQEPGRLQAAGNVGPQPVQRFAPTEPAYGHQDYMAVRNSAGL